MGETFFVLFYPPQRRKDNKPKIEINGHQFKEKNEMKYLRVFQDKPLSWKEYINHTLIKLAKTIGIIPKIKFFVSVKISKMFHCALFKAYLNYS